MRLLNASHAASTRVPQMEEFMGTDNLPKYAVLSRMFWLMRTLPLHYPHN